MIKPLLALCCTVLLPLSVGFAQSPAPTPRNDSPRTASPEKSGEKAAGENFVFAVAPVGKDGEGFSLIVTPPQVFHLSRSGLTFDGTLTLTDGGAYRLDYSFDTNAERGGTVHTGSSVLLRPGELIQFVKNGEQFCNLRFDRYPPPVDAAKPSPLPGVAH